jgi:phenylpropionate dioxygenase-like ring-hydroxylating dioxygenase large terminal subunit
VVLFRDSAGKAAALVDRCPHRGVALSLGTVHGGILECAFHGWRMDGAGRVCHVPWNPDAKLGTLGAIRIPVRELGGFVWIYTSPAGEGEPAPEGEPAVPDALLQTGVHVSGFAVEWKTHWTRAMENMLDWPHLPFVHRRTIGKGMVGRDGARMDVAWEPRPWGAHTHIRIADKVERGSLDFRWPNQMSLRIGPPRRLMIMLVSCVPIDETRTRMVVAMARDFLTSPLFDPLFRLANERILNEDRAVTESSYPRAVPPPGEEQSVRTDAPTLAFRKRYFEELRGSRSGAAEDAKRRLPVSAAPGS